MDANDLKKILAGFCIASLIAGASISLSACAAGNGGEKAGAGSAKSG